MTFVTLPLLQAVLAIRGVLPLFTDREQRSSKGQQCAQCHTANKGWKEMKTDLGSVNTSSLLDEDQALRWTLQPLCSFTQQTLASAEYKLQPAPNCF